MTEKRFHYDWKTNRFKDTQSNFCATSNMRVLETQINNACYNYEKKIEKLEKENKELKTENEQLKQSIYDWQGSYDGLYEDNLKLEKENKELKQFKDKVFKVIVEKIREYFQLQKDCETGKGWGSADRFIDYQMALIALKERLEK